MPSAPSTEPVRVALIGAGIFAQDAHVPSILRQPGSVKIVAIYSRTLAKAQALAEKLPHPVRATDDLAALLADPAVEAVAVLLPIPAMPAVIEQALAAGKHILSEKPVAPDVATGRRLLALHARRPDLVWMVGENWRYEEAFVRAAELVHDGAIGEPLTAHWAHFTPITARSKYYHTAWRFDGSFPGGFALDAGVHHVAVLRMLLGEVLSVSATAHHHAADLPSPDTLAATLRFAGGALGTYLATFATAAPWPPCLHVAGTQGALRVQRKEIGLTRDGQSEQITTSGFDGVEKAWVALAQSVRHGVPHRNPAAETLQDLAVMEAMLTSAAGGRPVAPERIV